MTAVTSSFFHLWLLLPVCFHVGTTHVSLLLSYLREFSRRICMSHMKPYCISRSFSSRALFSYLPAPQKSLRDVRLQHGRPRPRERPGGRPTNGAPPHRLAVRSPDSQGQRRRRPARVQEEPHDRDQSSRVSQRPDFQHHHVRLGASRHQPDTGEEPRQAEPASVT